MLVAGDPVPNGCGSVPKENRNRADGRHKRSSGRTWPNIGATEACPQIHVSVGTGTHPFYRSARYPFQNAKRAVARDLRHENVIPLPTGASPRVPRQRPYCVHGVREQRKAGPSELSDAEVWLVEPRGFEPLTSSLRTRRSPN